MSRIKPYYKAGFFSLFWPSWIRAVSVKNINSAWKSVGLNPWDPDVNLARFTRKQGTRRKTFFYFWSKLFPMVYDVKVRKLHETIMRLSTENILVKTCYTGLENALRNEQKEGQRGKPLQLRLQTPEDGNEIFYSPKKIQQARNLQSENEEAARLAKEAKEEDKIRQQQEKEEKQRLIEERKRIRDAGGRGKRRQKEEEKATKQAAIQPLNDIEQVDKDKKKSAEPVTAKENVGLAGSWITKHVIAARAVRQPY
ncbi:conserved hypothetical protein [Talaromyces stipitatus ATCC 10500]|uniref:Uncharacterized protein n=1 Tax=Talaromyces stipitatus (strain ATCC 10500 / CBS 375.48 / QM 6759 / NRRL 1006) TaxID=441959 RepID=B8MV80_TALSN|nr:uncharacterized protein TSTA_008320 [Talaromyces stipitatus ATCC 10500]EED11536.1 conserved hypothetical protein [Talaromyces stipitatus ATCC 10500]